MTLAWLNQPKDMVFDADGTLIIADTGNHRIRAVGADGIITTVVGHGTAGSCSTVSPAPTAVDTVTGAAGCMVTRGDPTRSM